MAAHGLIFFALSTSNVRNQSLVLRVAVFSSDGGKLRSRELFPMLCGILDRGRGGDKLGLLRSTA